MGCNCELPRRGDFEISAEEAAVVRRIYERYAEGKSARAIARELNTQGTPKLRNVGSAPPTADGSHQ